MDDQVSNRIHWSFWVISVIALIWNVLGGANYFMQMNSDIVSGLPDTHRAIIVGRPWWATGGFALTVFGGALGCLLLLLRKSAATYLFGISLAGVIVTMVHTVQVAANVIEFSLGEITVMVVLPVIVAGFLLWYAIHATNKAWLA